MSRALVVFSLIPDEVKFFAVPLDFEDIGILRGAHGAFINIEVPTPAQQRGVDYIVDAAGNIPEYATNVADVGKITQFEIDRSELRQPFAEVIWAEFYL